MGIIFKSQIFMKNNLLKFLPGLLLLSFSSCIKDKCTTHMKKIERFPIYMSYEDLRTGFKTITAQTLHDPGKIYYMQDYIFINEKYKGIHVINNQNPGAPVNVAFIEIPGNIDMAAKGNYLYVDSFVDLLVLDISNPAAPTLVKRLQHVLPYDNRGVADYDTTQGVIASYIETEVKEEVPCVSRGWGMRDASFTEGGSVQTSSNNNNAPATGKGGSMARFTIAKDFLYVVGPRNMELFNITALSNPVFSSTVNIGWDIETIFPYKNMLFIGSQTGMYIYDNSNPANPTFLSLYSHVRNCDPVVVQDTLAYVTLRTGTFCGGAVNQLDVVNIADPTSPQLLKTVELTNPHGLGINKNVLFICDGTDGLKLFDASQTSTLESAMKMQVKGYQTYDIIPLENLALVIGPDGFYQYSYTQDFKLQELSKIPVLR
jgi:hypothetical protein